jgi:hypothetical protein
MGRDLVIMVRNRRCLKTGEIVEVRSAGEIRATLDENGMLAGLPFMPEMQKYCGARLRVITPVRKALVEGTGYRFFDDIVLLEGASCDGKAHRDCQRMCNVLWNTAWLKKTDGSLAKSPGAGEPSAPEKSPAKYAALCQSANLKNTSSRVPFSVEGFLRNYTSKGSVRKFWILKRVSSFALYLVVKIKRILDRRHTMVGSLAKTPYELLNLKKGEAVMVKTKEEILTTLDKHGKNRGLAFTPEMARYCGNRFSVLRPVTKMIDEESGQHRTISGTVILENVKCDGKYHANCPRGCYLLWRETWLRRV